MEDWKTNLFIVSEKHRVVIFAIKSKLHVHELDPLTLEVRGLLKVLTLHNEDCLINNIRLVNCASADFIVTVDDQAFVRMFFLDNLDREPIRFSNISPNASDNSTWSCDGTGTNPPRVVVGSNAHTISIIDLSTEELQRIKAKRKRN